MPLRVILLLLLILPLPAHAATQVSVVGLTQGKAVLQINGGRPRTLAVGQASPEGVRLLAADSSRAVVEVDGMRRTLAMGQGAAVAGGAPSRQTATLYADPSGHFFTPGSINGRPVTFLVDTGASVLAISSAVAGQLGLDYRSGQVGYAQTAGGAVKTYRVSLNQIQFGGITLHQVEGVVLESDAPAFVLLGMSALNRVSMQRDGIALTLTKKY